MNGLFVRSRRSALTLLVAFAAVIPLAFAGVSSADTTPANTIALTAPTGIPGAPALPFTGVSASTFTQPASMQSLTVAPDQGVQGIPIKISGTGLAPNTTLQLTWGTWDATWLADVEPNTVNYLGTKYSALNINIATVTTDATGAFSFSTVAPKDFGGIHNIYAVSNGVALAHGGFEELRILSVTPRSGPVGTPITITYTSMGASLYTGGASVLWDNHYAGEMMANWTRGTGTVTLRAAGGVGKHFIQVGNAISYMYMNVIQSPIPYTNGATIPFTITKQAAPQSGYITWPADVTPTVSQVTTMSSVGLDPASSATAALSVTRGPVGTKTTLTVSGLPTNSSLNMLWSTVVGNRVNCASTCWSFSSIPLGSVTPSGGSVTASVTVPDNLGGWHVVQLDNSAGQVEAQVPFYVKESIVNFTNKAGKVLSVGLATANDANTAAALAVGQSGTPSHTFKAGQEFTISIKGVGWTQLDNTLGIDYDNSYVGYSCGFNSNGYMVIHLRATGAPGTHLIDLFPMLYSLSPSFASTPYGMVPDLTAGRDYPGLALGYQVPSMHFAITVVK